MSFKSISTVVVIGILALLAAGCGAIATPQPAAPLTPQPFTLVPRPTEIAEAGEADTGTDQATTIPPTAVPLPTATEVPPTATPTEIPATATPTTPPTSVPTDVPVAIGDAANGEHLFTTGKEAAPACGTCHRVDQDMVLIGPSLIGVAARAATRVEGQNAEEYLRQSILEPNAYLVPNTDTNVFAAGETSLMFQQYGDYLTEQDINDLVAYLLTLE